MPYLEHVRITARFSMGTSSDSFNREQASCTVNFDSSAVPIRLAADRQLLVDDAMSDWSTWVTDSDSKVSSAVILHECRLYVIDTDGHSEYDTAISTADSVAGTATTNRHPYQNSIVGSLYAGPRGAGRFGRVFLPPQCYPVDESGVIETSTFNLMWGTFQTLMANLSNIPDLDLGWQLAIASKVGSGSLRPVTKLRMGHIADTQRRRRRSLDEAYSVADFSG